MQTNPEFIDCACLIHGDAYDWTYVEKLYSMLQRNFSVPVKLHVFTEESRPVPSNMIKHALKEWPGVAGPKKAWWYKMQMFDRNNFAGQLLYFDLDVVIVNNLDWIMHLSRDYFWTIRDFRYLWRPTWAGINSSVMYWDTNKFHHIWRCFSKQDLAEVMRTHPGDQDFLSNTIGGDQRRFFKEKTVCSWRWQIFDAGMDMQSRSYRRPGAGAIVPPETSIIVFHGRPKPIDIKDQYIINNWV